ncbi:MAG: collagen-like protein [Bacteroidota bacterium]
MKKLFLFFAVSSSLIFSSCEGDPGPPGEPGINILGQVFEVTVDFTVGNDFRQLVTIPSSVEVFESDAILVYWLEDVVDDGNGGTLDVWSPLPQTIYLDTGGSFQYTFNHSFIDVLLFLQGDVDLGTLGNQFTNDQIFRIAVVPSEFADANLTMEQLMNSDDFVFLGN